MKNFTKHLFLEKMVRSFLIFLIFLSFSNLAYAQVEKNFTARKTVERIKGDFTLIGNHNITVKNNPIDGDNNSENMDYVDIDTDNTTVNSSSANLVFSTENGAIASQSKIKFAGLYWTGRAHTGSSSPDTFTVVGSVSLNKRVVKLKVPGTSTYQNITANTTDIRYPSGTNANMYVAFADVTTIIEPLSNKNGTYTVANIALREADPTDDTGYYGGWALIVVYENDKMNWRDVVVFDGYAYVAGNVTADFNIPVTGFKTTDTGAVNMKLGVMAGEGDRKISGDNLQILKHSTISDWVSLNHTDNSTTNFFNSSIYSYTNNVKNPRNPDHTNNFGLDISMFNIANSNNSVIKNNQTSTTFKYGSTQDTYIIFCFAMAVDAWIPEINLTKTANPTTYSSVGQPITYTFKVENTGNLPLTNVTRKDPTIGQTFGPIATLAAGASQTYTTTYYYTSRFE